MKRFQLLAAVLVCGCLQSSLLAADTVDKLLVTGGTEANIQAALQEARSRKQLVSPKASIGGSTYTWVQPPVVLRGYFQITKSIKIERADQIVGEGALLDCGGMKDKDAYVFDGNFGGWRSSIRGQLAILGAPNGIRLRTGDMVRNLAGGLSLIEGIEIANCRGVAIWVESRSNTVEISRCKFHKVQKIAVNRMCDNLLFRECWVYPAAPPQDDYAYLTHNYGKLRIEGGIWTPHHGCKKRARVSWVEMKDCPDTNEFMFVADKTRFGGEHAGLFVVRNYQAGRSPQSGPDTMAGVSIRLRDLNCYNHPSQREYEIGVKKVALILLDRLPNLIEVSGCVGTVKGPIVALAPDAPKDFAGILNLGSSRHPGRITIPPTNLIPKGQHPVADELLPWLTN